MGGANHPGSCARRPARESLPDRDARHRVDRPARPRVLDGGRSVDGRIDVRHSLRTGTVVDARSCGTVSDRSEAAESKR